VSPVRSPTNEKDNWIFGEDCGRVLIRRRGGEHTETDKDSADARYGNDVGYGQFE